MVPAVYTTSEPAATVVSVLLTVQFLVLVSQMPPVAPVVLVFAVGSQDC